MKTCQECQDRIVGREDKRFCCDGCRNAYNNRLNRDRNKYVRNINSKLRRNHRILTQLNTTGKARLSRCKLADRGFDFEYFTNIRQTRTATYYFLYDQGYRKLDDQFCLLVKKE